MAVTVGDVPHTHRYGVVQVQKSRPCVGFSRRATLEFCVKTPPVSIASAASGPLRSLKHCGVFNGVRRITATHQTRRRSPKHIERTSAGCCQSAALPGNRQRGLFSAVLPQPQEFAPAHLHLLSQLKRCQHPPLRLFLQGFLLTHAGVWEA